MVKRLYSSSHATNQVYGRLKRPKKQMPSAKQLQLAVKKAIMKTAENKEFTNSQAVSAITAGGQVIQLNNIAEGTEINQRVGRHLTPRGIDVICEANNSTTTISQDVLHVCLVWDRQPDGTAPSYATIFDTASSSDPALSFRNTLQFKDRFTFLWEEWMVVQTYNTATVSGNFENLIYRKYKDLTKNARTKLCEYGSAAAAVPNTGALYLTVCSLLNTGNTTGAAGFRYTSKFTYTDF